VSGSDPALVGFGSHSSLSRAFVVNPEASRKAVNLLANQHLNVLGDGLLARESFVVSFKGEDTG
jgi:hypothetical protein